MKIIARYFRWIFAVLFLIYTYLKMLPSDTDIVMESLGYGLVTTLLCIGIFAVVYDDRSKNSFVLRTLSIILSGVAIIALMTVVVSYSGFLFRDLPTWLRFSIRVPSSLAVFLSVVILGKTRQGDATAANPIVDSDVEFSEKLLLNNSESLPTYMISTLLSIDGNKDKIVMLRYTASFQNVFRCTPDGEIVWQAELPTTNDVYTNIEWRDNRLIAYSRSCMAVNLDMQTGKILPAKGFLQKVAA